MSQTHREYVEAPPRASANIPAGTQELDELQDELTRLTCESWRRMERQIQTDPRYSVIRGPIGQARRTFQRLARRAVIARRQDIGRRRVQPVPVARQLPRRAGNARRARGRRAARPPDPLGCAPGPAPLGGRRAGGTSDVDGREHTDSAALTPRGPAW